MEWDNNKCIQVIELYQAKPEMWQTTHAFYHHKGRKQEAWMEIANSMGTTVDVVKSKLNSLLSSFRRERAKEKNHVDTGRDEAYKSKWFAYDSFQFLMDVKKSKKTPSIAQNKSDFHEENEIEITENRADDDEVSSDTDVANTPQATGYIDCQAAAASSARASAFVPPRATKERKLESHNQPSHPRMMDAAMNLLQCDACEAFGKYVAIKLRTYGKRTQAVVQHLFSDIIFKADMGQYDNLNDNPPNHSSNVWFTSASLRPRSEAPSPCFSGLASPKVEDYDDENQ